MSLWIEADNLRMKCKRLQKKKITTSSFYFHNTRHLNRPCSQTEKTLNDCKFSMGLYYCGKCKAPTIKVVPVCIYGFSYQQPEKHYKVLSHRRTQHKGILLFALNPPLVWLYQIKYWTRKMKSNKELLVYLYCFRKHAWNRKTIILGCLNNPIDFDKCALFDDPLYIITITKPQNHIGESWMMFSF